MQCTSTEEKRELILDGENGHVVCKIFGSDNDSTLPTISKEWKLNSATNSLLRMKNLTVYRGDWNKGSQTCMYGPCNFFGSLENIRDKFYTVEIKKVPVFYFHGYGKKKKIEKIFKPKETLVENVNWVSHVFEKSKNSLFPKPGFLYVSTRDIVLKSYNPVETDLSPYRAVLVKNTVPFQLIKETFPNTLPKEAYDDLRVIDYIFGHEYSKYQTKESEGLFLEHHKFIQTMTPLDEKCGGFVILGRLTYDINVNLILTAVQIPLGYTLIVQSGCIHGDTNLSGHYMMAMTSDHKSMATADTVFLRTYENKNVNVSLDIPNIIPFKIKENVIKNKVIFNPFSKGYWSHIKNLIKN